jgi:hypothetical protein
MSEKFKYAPGRPGFGTKGEKGSDGKQGLAMYFTDLNPNSQKYIIELRIQNNESLWSTGYTPLPNERVYVTGDLFFDSEGLAYEINAEEYTFEYKFASLNMGGFFIPLGISSSDGFQRYFNSNTSLKYLIDNVYTVSGAIDYTDVPESIYGLEPKNFARIEYTNIKPIGTYNPFTVYSSGEVVGADDHKSIAIVYDETNNTFRIGNLNNTGNLRNTNLIFDVSSLKIKKEAGNYFNENTPVGTILTNYEINSNTLFDPNFISLPTSFVGAFINPTSCYVKWTLSDFVNDPNITGDLYFFEKVTASGSFSLDASRLRPLIFTNVSNTTDSSVIITGISSSKIYSYYMKLNKNGWSRNSEAQNLYLGAIDVFPKSFSQNSSDLGDYEFDVSANFTWNASIYQNPENFMSITSCPSGGDISFPEDGSIFIHITENASTKARLGKIRVHLLPGTTIYKDVSIWQARGSIGPELFLYSPPPNGTSNFSYVGWPNYSIDASQNGTIKGSYTIYIDVSSNHSWSIDTPPSWMTLSADSSGAGHTTIALLVDSNLTLSSRSDILYFNYGGDSPVSLYIWQESTEVWVESGATRYDFPLNLYYNSGSNILDINTTPQGSGSSLYLNMRFTGGSSIDWQWDNTTLGWLSMTDRSGTGDNYGPSFSAIGSPIGSEWIDGSAGEVYSYPLIINVGGS